MQPEGITFITFSNVFPNFARTRQDESSAIASNKGDTTGINSSVGKHTNILNVNFKRATRVYSRTTKYLTQDILELKTKYLQRI